MAVETAALILAAGQGHRAGGGLPKQFRPLAGLPMLAHAVRAFAGHPAVDRVQVVAAAGREADARAALEGAGLEAGIGTGGASRQESVALGLAQLGSDPPRRVLVHDAARPLVPRALIDRVLAALDDHAGAVPALPVVDSLRRGDRWIESEVPRDGLWAVQTPQGFDYRLLAAAHAAAPPGATDDAEVMRAAGHRVALVPGSPQTMKVTDAADFAAVERWMDWVSVTGTGFDVHRFGPGDHVWLCGVRVPHGAGLVGHSDADAGLHALTDAVLGAIGDGDIGAHFPPSDPQWRGASSDRFLAHAAERVAAAGGRIVHVDVTLIAEAPRIGPYRASMVERIAAILAAHRPRVSVKATTTEGLGLAGRREGLAAQAAATIRLPDWDRP